MTPTIYLNGLSENAPSKPALSASAITTKDNALTESALVARVSNAEQNATAVQCIRSLKAIDSAIEKARKDATEPLLQRQRDYMAAVKPHREELQKEIGRLENLINGFALEERRRVNEAIQSAEAAGESTDGIAPTRAHGQTTRTEWEIIEIREFQLLRNRPDLVRKVEFDIRGIKDALSANGGKLPGVTAKQVINTGVRVTRKTLDVVATVQ